MSCEKAIFVNNRQLTLHISAGEDIPSFIIVARKTSHESAWGSDPVELVDAHCVKQARSEQHAIRIL